MAFTSLYLAAGAMMPVLAHYQQRWGLPTADITLAFAVYAAGFLAAALSVGSLSDHVGRRPVLLGALSIQLVSNTMFLIAPDLCWVIVGRLIQGAATGAATGAFTAALVELAPVHRRRLGAVLGGVGLAGGLALGSLLAGIAIQLVPAGHGVVFGLLSVLTVLGLGVVAVSPETIARNAGALRSLIPRVAIPRPARREFIAAVPVIGAVWMLAGLTGGLAPSLVHSVFHVQSGVLSGLSGFASPATSAVSALAVAVTGARRAMIIGCCASVLGAIGMVVGAVGGGLTAMIVGQAVTGVGFGAAFTAALEVVVPLAPERYRAGLASAVFVCAYVAFGVPVVMAGWATVLLGDAAALALFSTLAVAVALLGLYAQIRLGPPSGRSPEPNGTGPI